MFVVYQKKLVWKQTTYEHTETEEAVTGHTQSYTKFFTNILYISVILWNSWVCKWVRLWFLWFLLSVFYFFCCLCPFSVWWYWLYITVFYFVVFCCYLLDNNCSFLTRDPDVKKGGEDLGGGEGGRTVFRLHCIRKE